MVIMDMELLNGDVSVPKILGGVGVITPRILGGGEVTLITTLIYATETPLIEVERGGCP